MIDRRARECRKKSCRPKSSLQFTFSQRHQRLPETNKYVGDSISPVADLSADAAVVATVDAWRFCDALVVVTEFARHQRAAVVVVLLPESAHGLEDE